MIFLQIVLRQRIRKKKKNKRKKRKKNKKRKMEVSWKVVGAKVILKAKVKARRTQIRKISILK